MFRIGSDSIRVGSIENGLSVVLAGLGAVLLGSRIDRLTGSFSIGTAVRALVPSVACLGLAVLLRSYRIADLLTLVFPFRSHELRNLTPKQVLFALVVGFWGGYLVTGGRISFFYMPYYLVVLLGFIASIVLAMTDDRILGFQAFLLILPFTNSLLEAVLKPLSRGKSLNQEVDHSNLNHGFAVGRQDFIIYGRPFSSGFWVKPEYGPMSTSSQDLSTTPREF